MPFSYANPGPTFIRSRLSRRRLRLTLERPHCMSLTRRCSSMSRTLVIIGLAVAAVGLLWPWMRRLGLRRLQGDIFIQREGFTLYAPITSGILAVFQRAILDANLEWAL